MVKCVVKIRLALCVKSHVRDGHMNGLTQDPWLLIHRVYGVHWASVLGSTAVQTNKNPRVQSIKQLWPFNAWLEKEREKEVNRETFYSHFQSVEKGNQSLGRKWHNEKFIENQHPIGYCNDDNDSDNDNDTQIIMSCCTLTIKLFFTNMLRLITKTPWRSVRNG